MAIAITTDVADKIDGVGQVGGVVGTPPRHVLTTTPPARSAKNFPSGSSVSASFLFIVGLANSIILHRVLRKRRLVRAIRRNS